MEELKNNKRFFYAVKNLRKYGFKLDFDCKDKYRVLKRSDNSLIVEYDHLNDLALFAHIAHQKYPKKKLCPTMPRNLTSENGAKQSLMGDFHVLFREDCPECDGVGGSDDGQHTCMICDGEGYQILKIPIPWDTIKDIYKRIVSDVEAGYIKAD